MSFELHDETEVEFKKDVKAKMCSQMSSSRKAKNLADDLNAKVTPLE